MTKQGRITIHRCGLNLEKRLDDIITKIENDEKQYVIRKLWKFDYIYVIHASGQCTLTNRKKGTRNILERTNQTSYNIVVGNKLHSRINFFVY